MKAALALSLKPETSMPLSLGFVACDTDATVQNAHAHTHTHPHTQTHTHTHTHKQRQADPQSKPAHLNEPKTLKRNPQAMQFPLLVFVAVLGKSWFRVSG